MNVTQSRRAVEHGRDEHNRTCRSGPVEALETLTVPNWLALYDRSCEIEREATKLRRASDEAHCPAHLMGQFRCALDVDHDGEHRIDQGAWSDPRTAP